MEQDTRGMARVVKKQTLTSVVLDTRVVTERFEKERSEMSDEELIKHADRAVSKLCETGGRSFTMTVPPRITDTDMVLSEVIKRFKTTSESCRGCGDEYIKMRKLDYGTENN